MSMSQRLKEFLEAQHVPYEVHEHPVAYTARAVAAADHVPATEMAKVVVLRSERQFLMAVLPASRDLDLQRARDAVGDRRLRLASEDELTGLFPDCEVGAMPPFGDLFGLPVWVDDSLGREAETVFNAGSHRETVHMAYKDFVRLAHPSFGELGSPPARAF